MLTLVRVCRVVRGARLRQSVDRNSFRLPCGEHDTGSVQPCPIGSTSVGTAIYSRLHRRNAGNAESSFNPSLRPPRL